MGDSMDTEQGTEPTPLHKDTPPQPTQPRAPFDIIGVLVVCHGAQFLLKTGDVSSPGICQVCGTHMQAGDVQVNCVLRPTGPAIALPNGFPGRPPR